MTLESKLIELAKSFEWMVAGTQMEEAVQEYLCSMTQPTDEPLIDRLKFWKRTLKDLCEAPEQKALVDQHFGAAWALMQPEEPTPPEPGPEPEEVVWRLTPNSIEVPVERMGSGVIQPGDPTTIETTNPINECYGARYHSSSSYNKPPMCERGDVIELGPGEYKKSGSGTGVRCTRGPDGKGEKPDDQLNYYQEQGLVLDGEPRITPVPMTTFRSADKDNRAAIIAGDGSQALYCPEVDSRVRWEDIDFLGGNKACIQTENPFSARWNPYYGGGPYDIQFDGCTFIGLYSYFQGTGSKDTYWLRRAYGHGQTLFLDAQYWDEKFSNPHHPGLIISNCEFLAPFKEHHIYESNCQGNVWYYRLDQRFAGRTANQRTNRSNDGPWGKGTHLIEECKIRDVCLQDGGGGSALRVAGRYNGLWKVLNTSVRLGHFHDQLAERFQKVGATGCIDVGPSKYPESGRPGAPADRSKDPADWTPCDRVELVDSEFWINPEASEGTGARDNVVVQWAHHARIEGCKISREHTNRMALSIGENVEELILKKNDVVGKCRYIDTVYDSYRDMLAAIRGREGVMVVT